MTVRYGLRSDTPANHHSFEASLIVMDGGNTVMADLTITHEKPGVHAAMPGLDWQGYYSSEKAAIDAAKVALGEAYG